MFLAAATSSMFRRMKKTRFAVLFSFGILMSPMEPVGRSESLRLYPHGRRDHGENQSERPHGPQKMRRRFQVLPVTVVPGLYNVPFSRLHGGYFVPIAWSVAAKAFRGPWATGDPCKINHPDPLTFGAL